MQINNVCNTAKAMLAGNVQHCILALEKKKDQYSGFLPYKLIRKILEKIFFPIREEEEQNKPKEAE